MNKNLTKVFLSTFFAVFLTWTSYSQSTAYEQGETFFRQNQPEQAIPLLQKSIAENDNPRAFMYLALSYYQVGKYPEALEVCSAGMTANGTNKKILSYNAGNIAFTMEDYAVADRWYSISISADSTFAPPVLNRAQARLKLGKIKDARTDYRRYLELYPQTPQRDQIEELLRLLDSEIAQEEAEVERIKIENARIEAENARIEAARVEAERVAAEEAAAEQRRAEAAKAEAEARAAQELARQKAEEARIAAEKEAEAKRLAEEEAERQRKLLEDVAASLQDTESQNMSAGAEGTVGYGYESELE